MEYCETFQVQRSNLRSFHFGVLSGRGNNSVCRVEDKGYSSQDVALVIIGAGLANANALVLFDGALKLWNTIVGIIILCILQAYAPVPTSSSRLNLAYAATWSISFLATVGVVFNMILGIFVVNGLILPQLR